MNKPIDLEDIFQIFQGGASLNRDRYQQKDLEVILGLVTVPHEERIRQILEATFDKGRDAHQEEIDLQKKDPEHTITDRNPWRKR